MIGKIYSHTFLTDYSVGQLIKSTQKKTFLHSKGFLPFLALFENQHREIIFKERQ